MVLLTQHVRWSGTQVVCFFSLLVRVTDIVQGLLGLLLHWPHCARLTPSSLGNEMLFGQQGTLGNSYACK